MYNLHHKEFAMKTRIVLSYLEKLLCRPHAGLLAVLLLIGTSCEDVLMEEPKTVAAELFYNTAEEVEVAVNAIYSPWRTNTHAVYSGVLDIHTDYGYGRGSYAQYNDFQGMNANNINRTAGFWNFMYLSIRNANLVIANAPGGTDISQEDIDMNVAEAKFMRAFSYFHLVRNWGGVPLRTEETMIDKDLARSSEAEVYDLILADLAEAELNLPDEPKHIGRPNKLAAKTLLADVYLTLGRFAEARDKANEVIQSNEYSLVPVATSADFQKIFGPTVTTTPEEIFYFKHIRLDGYGNYLPWILNHPSTGKFAFGGAYAHYGESTDPFYTTWDDADLRKEMWDIVNFGLGATTMVSSKFIDPEAPTSSDAGNDSPQYRYAEVLLIYAEAATRAAGAPTPEAVEALNKVHRRAYGYPANTPSAVDFNIGDYDEQSFVDLVIKERGYEFIFEGKRWFDLKRTGTADEILLANRGITIADSHYLWPIPVGEISFNDAINPEHQNPGY